MKHLYKGRCPYCGADVVLKEESYVKKKGKKDVYLYVCSNYPICNSYVGCHKNSTLPLGSISSPELRNLRRKTHFYFDLLWKEGYMSRSNSYAWLTKKLKIPPDCCHIGKFNPDLCKRTIKEVLIYLYGQF